MRVYLGSDHAGFELKTRLIEWLAGAGHEPVDCGPKTYVEDDDYPPYVMSAAHGVINDPGSLGIVIGGSGNGEQIAVEQDPRRPRGGGLDRPDRPAGPPAQRRQRTQPRRAHVQR